MVAMIMSTINLFMTMTIMTIMVTIMMMKIIQIIAMTYIMTTFKMVDDQEDVGYKDEYDEDYGQGHEPL